MKKFLTFFMLIFTSALISACSSSGQLTAQADYSPYFNNITGCAVFYDVQNNTYTFYNEDMCNTRYSPYSTFKIVATLEGLKSGVITSESSTMNYSGDTYPFDSWNKNLNLKEAFQSSCVWYFRQVIDSVGQQTMSNDLINLNYGNCDVSQWEGSNINAQKELNGFWLDSSLKISPVESVNVLSNIFEGKTDYSQKDIDILKSIMKSETQGVYGKTGTGKDGTAWYTGFYEDDGNRTYFSILLHDQAKTNIAGADAKNIAIDIITNEINKSK